MSLESFAVSVSVDSMSAEKCLFQAVLLLHTDKYCLNLSEHLDRAEHTSCVCFVGFSVGLLLVYLASGPWRRISISVLLACYTHLVVTKRKRK